LCDTDGEQPQEAQSQPVPVREYIDSLRQAADAQSRLAQQAYPIRAALVSRLVEQIANTLRAEGYHVGEFRPGDLGNVQLSIIQLAGACVDQRVMFGEDPEEGEEAGPLGLDGDDEEKDEDDDDEE
jgi:hypothetical protein